MRENAFSASTSLTDWTLAISKLRRCTEFQSSKMIYMSRSSALWGKGFSNLTHRLSKAMVHSSWSRSLSQALSLTKSTSRTFSLSAIAWRTWCKMTRFSVQSAWSFTSLWKTSTTMLRLAQKKNWRKAPSRKKSARLPRYKLIIYIFLGECVELIQPRLWREWVVFQKDQSIPTSFSQLSQERQNWRSQTDRWSHWSTAKPRFCIRLGNSGG